MIAQHHDSTDIENNLQRQIKTKKTQLKIAQENNMLYVAEALQRQLEELQKDSEFQALMSLLDD
jgi:hypothetical protein